MDLRHQPEPSGLGRGHGQRRQGPLGPRTEGRVDRKARLLALHDVAYLHILRGLPRGGITSSSENKKATVLKKCEYVMVLS